MLTRGENEQIRPNRNNSCSKRPTTMPRNYEVKLSHTKRSGVPNGLLAFVGHGYKQARSVWKLQQISQSRQTWPMEHYNGRCCPATRKEGGLRAHAHHSHQRLPHEGWLQDAGVLPAGIHIARRRGHTWRRLPPAPVASSPPCDRLPGHWEIIYHT